jgi:bifunctional UDP-N-acetylglucosamine pyrophosphorylase/glucosamine-1-phosphate N-acetyltransferase
MDDSIAAIVLAAGLGVRMRSQRAKVLHQLGGESLIRRSLRPFASLDPQPLIVVTGHQAREVENEVRTSFPHVVLNFAIQREQRGTGDAVRCAITELPNDFTGKVLIGYGDMPLLSAASLTAFVQAHRAGKSPLSFISTMLDNPAGYGRVIRDAHGSVTRIVEERDATADERMIKEVNTGIYLVDARFLCTALEQIRPSNAQHEYYLTDIVAIARERGLTFDTWNGENAKEFAGVNSREELARMEMENREETNRRWMTAGVTFIDSATAYIGPEVTIGQDTTIGPNVQIMGKSSIGTGVLIEGTAWLRDVVIGDRCHLKLGVRAERCEIGDDCEIGPFANLREGTRLAGHNRIGNFVETKQATIGHGTKASHLSYLGDAIIGADTNIGCGVITVNYDGYDKHQTRIGDRCMVGCDTQLIAPVKVGDDVYVASGTTILRDIENGALAVSDHPQREKPGWTAKWHARHADHPKAKKDK